MVRVENTFLMAGFLKQLAMQYAEKINSRWQGFLSSCAVCRENRELKQARFKTWTVTGSELFSLAHTQPHSHC